MIVCTLKTLKLLCEKYGNITFKELHKIIEREGIENVIKR